MTRWLERQEAVQRFSSYLAWAVPATDESESDPSDNTSGSTGSASAFSGMSATPPAPMPSQAPSGTATQSLLPISTTLAAHAILPSHSQLPGATQHALVGPVAPPIQPAPSSAAVACSAVRSAVVARANLDAPEEEPEEDVWKHGYRLAKVPAFPSLTVTHIVNTFGASNFKRAVAEHLTRLAGTNSRRLALVRTPLHDLTRIAVYKQFKVRLPVVRQVSSSVYVDIVHASPPQTSSSRAPLRSTIPANMSTVFARDPGEASPARAFNVARPLADLGVARVRVVFELPPMYDTGALGVTGPLAYVEWFTPFNVVDDTTGMYVVSPSTRRHERYTSVIPISDIVRSCHLLPIWGKRIERRVVVGDILDNIAISHRVTVSTRATWSYRTKGGAISATRTIVPVRKSRHKDKTANFTAYDIWCAGASHKTFAVIEDDEDAAVAKLLKLIRNARDVSAQTHLGESVQRALRQMQPLVSTNREHTELFSDLTVDMGECALAEDAGEDVVE